MCVELDFSSTICYRKFAPVFFIAISSRCLDRIAKNGVIGVNDVGMG